MTDRRPFPHRLLQADVSLWREDYDRQPSPAALVALLDAKLALTRESLVEELETLWAGVRAAAYPDERSL